MAERKRSPSATPAASPWALQLGSWARKNARSGWGISPKTFPVLVREGTRLSQMRLHRGNAALDAEALRGLHARERLVDRAEAVMGDGIAVSIDLSGGARQSENGGGIVGYRAKRHTAVIDVERLAA